MENTVNVENLLQEIDETHCYMREFFICLNKLCRTTLELYKQGHTTHGCSFEEKKTSCKKAIKHYIDQICLLKLDFQIESDAYIKINIVNHYASIFFYEVFEKICTFEFSKNDIITAKWYKDFYEHLVNRSAFCAQKAKNEISDKLPEEL